MGAISKARLPALPRTRGTSYSVFAIKSRLNSWAWNSKQSAIWLPLRPPTAPPPPASPHYPGDHSHPPLSLLTTDPNLPALGPGSVLCEACSDPFSPHASLPFLNSYSTPSLHHVTEPVYSISRCSLVAFLEVVVRRNRGAARRPAECPPGLQSEI